MINVKNPPGLSLGENRFYFGIWAIMKAPLLLSSDLPMLIPEVTAIINNTEVIAFNQDRLGVQARKLAIDGQVHLLARGTDGKCISAHNQCVIYGGPGRLCTPTTLSASALGPDDWMAGRTGSMRQCPQTILHQVNG